MQLRIENERFKKGIYLDYIKSVYALQYKKTIEYRIQLLV